MKIRIAGDSHTGTLYRAWRLMREEGHWPFVTDIEFGTANGKLWRRSFYADLGEVLDIVDSRFCQVLGFQSVSKGQLADQIIGLCLHTHSAPFWRDPQWLAYAPVGLQTKEAPLSRQIIERMVLDFQKEALNFTRLLRRFCLKVFAIEAPHPFKDHRAIAQLEMRPDVIVAVDRMYRTVIRLALEDMSVPTMGVPPECLGSDGFMKPEYRSERKGDQHHANAAYGRQMMSQLPQFLERHFPGTIQRG